MEAMLNSPGCCCAIAKGEILASCVYDLPLMRYLQKHERGETEEVWPYVPYSPWGRAFELELRYVANTEVLPPVEGHNRRSLGDIHPDRTIQRVGHRLFAVRRILHRLDRDNVRSNRVERVLGDVQLPEFFL